MFLLRSFTCLCIRLSLTPSRKLKDPSSIQKRVSFAFLASLCSAIFSNFEVDNQLVILLERVKFFSLLGSLILEKDRSNLLPLIYICSDSKLDLTTQDGCKMSGFPESGLEVTLMLCLTTKRRSDPNLFPKSPQTGYSSCPAQLTPSTICMFRMRYRLKGELAPSSKL